VRATGLQPIWFQHTGKEFPEVEEFVQRTSADYLTYRGGLKTPDGEDVNRMWVVQANTSKEFNEAMAQVDASTRHITFVAYGSWFAVWGFRV
jgi:hypothetical protein